MDVEKRCKRYAAEKIQGWIRIYARMRCVCKTDISQDRNAEKFTKFLEQKCNKIILS
jgi:hypothetical protein